MIEKISPYFFAIIILSIIAEALYSYNKGKKLFDLRDTWTSLTFGILGVFTRLLFKAINLAIWIFLFKFSLFQFETGWLSLSILFLLNEFIYYWFHRLSHEIPVLWATHVNHHSSIKMNFAVAARTPFLNAIYHVLFWIPLPLLGFNPIDILLVETISFFFAFVQHTTVITKLGVFEYFLNTPSHHRVHHAVNPKYINKNYGNTLIIYDKLFGTFQEEVETPIYGLTRNPVNRGFLNMVFHGWREFFGINRKQGFTKTLNLTELEKRI